MCTNMTGVSPLIGNFSNNDKGQSTAIHWDSFLNFVAFILGLIDGHTHPVWVGDRVHEFAMKVSLPIRMLIHHSLYIFYGKDKGNQLAL